MRAGTASTGPFTGARAFTEGRVGNTSGIAGARPNISASSIPDTDHRSALQTSRATTADSVSRQRASVAASAGKKPTDESSRQAEVEVDMEDAGGETLNAGSHTECVGGWDGKEDPMDIDLDSDVEMEDV